MADTDLSDQDNIFKARALEQRMRLEKDLKTLGDSLDELFRIAPPLKLTPLRRWLHNVIGGATNEHRTRVLDLLRKGLGSSAPRAPTHRFEVA